MTALTFPDRAAYDIFEAKMAARDGIPKPGRNAASGAIVDPDNLTGRGWTRRSTYPVDELELHPHCAATGEVTHYNLPVHARAEAWPEI